jgi:hypothetical protein
MKSRIWIPVSLLLSIVSVAAIAKQPAKIITLTDSKGNAVGTASIEQEKQGVQIHLAL